MEKHNLHTHCLDFHFPISDLKTSTSVRFFSSSVAIFHALDRKHRKVVKPK